MRVRVSVGVRVRGLRVLLTCQDRFDRRLRGWSVRGCLRDDEARRNIRNGRLLRARGERKEGSGSTRSDLSRRRRRRARVRVRVRWWLSEPGVGRERYRVIRQGEDWQKRGRRRRRSTRSCLSECWRRVQAWFLRAHCRYAEHGCLPRFVRLSCRFGRKKKVSLTDFSSWKERSVKERCPRFDARCVVCFFEQTQDSRQRVVERERSEVVWRAREKTHLRAGKRSGCVWVGGVRLVREVRVVLRRNVSGWHVTEGLSAVSTARQIASARARQVVDCLTKKRLFLVFPSEFSERSAYGTLAKLIFLFSLFWVRSLPLSLSLSLSLLSICISLLAIHKLRFLSQCDKQDGRSGVPKFKLLCFF